MPRRRALADDVTDRLSGVDPKKARKPASYRGEVSDPRAGKREKFDAEAVVADLDDAELSALEDAIYDRRRALEDEAAVEEEEAEPRP
jgi:hypothetical protein